MIKLELLEKYILENMIVKLLIIVDYIIYLKEGFFIMNEYGNKFN